MSKTFVYFWFSTQVYEGFDGKINSPGSQKVQAVPALLSLQQAPVWQTPNTGDQSAAETSENPVNC